MQAGRNALDIASFASSPYAAAYIPVQDPTRPSTTVLDTRVQCFASTALCPAYGNDSYGFLIFHCLLVALACVWLCSSLGTVCDMLWVGLLRLLLICAPLLHQIVRLGGFLYNSTTFSFLSSFEQKLRVGRFAQAFITFGSHLSVASAGPAIHAHGGAARSSVSTVSGF